MSTWTERQFGSDTEAVEFNLNYPFFTTDEGQLGAPKTRAGRLKAHLRAAATFRFKSSGRTVLFDQLKARSISAGDQGDEEAAREIAAIGHRDRAGETGCYRRLLRRSRPDWASR